MPRVVISELMDEVVVDGMRQWAEVDYRPDLANGVGDALADADGLVVRNVTRVDGRLLELGKKLCVVGRLGTGTDNIDQGACAERGVQVRTAAGANAVAVAEYALGAMLCLLRRALVATGAVVEGSWPRSAMVGSELSGRRLGIVGLGAIGHALATRATAMGMDVAATDPYARSASIPLLPLTRLAERSDVLSVHVPLTDATIGMIDPGVLDRLPPGAMLVDASRGGVVDHDAVIERLMTGRMGGAAFDVFEVEPVTPDLGGRYRGVPNLILTPHVAGLTVESNRRVSQMVADAIREVLVP